MVNLKIYPYKTGSNSCKGLGEFLSCKVLKREGSKFKGGPNYVVINWGSSSVPGFRAGTSILNKPEVVRLAGNKLDFFKHLSTLQPSPLDTGYLIPWTDKKEEALKWLQKGSTVVARKKLTGHSGEGIEIIDPDGVQGIENAVASDNELDIPDAPLYTKYIKKQAEYRVHVAFGKVIDVQKKIRDPNREPTTWFIRSHQNGFIYVRNNVQPSDKLLEVSKQTVEALGLDFGAVDCISTKSGKLYVLEVNCAPGLEGSTVSKYAEAFKGYLNEV